MIKVRKLKYSGDYRMKFWFSDDSTGELDFSKIVSEPGEMIEPLRDSTFFAQAFLEFGAPTWPNGYDISPGALFQEMKDAGLLHREEMV